MEGHFKNVYVQNWLQLSVEIRNHLRTIFDIPRTGITEVRDTSIISDGTTNEDLGTITVDKMEKYVGSKETFPRLWELTLAKAKYELHPPMNLMDVKEVTINDSSINTNAENKEESTEIKTTTDKPIKRPTFRATEVSTESKPSEIPGKEVVS